MNEHGGCRQKVPGAQIYSNETEQRYFGKNDDVPSLTKLHIVIRAKYGFIPLHFTK
ncbi:hypothetical protein PAJ34TS1_46500 [Paenibacillus azoreducens]|uniref:Uncharacterized protein n=1 Tax=Paenibacillus azoreducens TaxID=116718 RepID=A0A919YF44_9BACL|nr:hypothetical protein J34TS1_28880 [Paenibacillus azoreducens]